MPWQAEEARSASVVHVAGELRDLLGATQAPNRGDVPERPALVVGQHTLFDETRAPAGQHTLYVYGHVPSQERDVPDAEFADRMQAQIERFAPGFGALVIARSVRPPELSERENPAVHGVSGDAAARAVLEDRSRWRVWRRP